MVAALVVAAIALADGGLEADADNLVFVDQSHQGGTPETQTTTVTNGTGDDLTIASVIDDSDQFELLDDQPGIDCAAGPLLDGATCEVRVEFDPTSEGVKTGTVTIDTDGPSETIGLEGEGTQPDLTPTSESIPFGSVEVGSSSGIESRTFTNEGSEPVDIVAANKTGADPGDFVIENDLATDCKAAVSVPVGQTCTLRARFTPSARDGRSATVTIDSDAPDVTVTLSGTGTETKLTPTTDSIAFASRDLLAGPSAIETRAFENTGNVSVTVANVNKTGAHPGDFVIEDGEITDCRTGKVVAVGATCDLRVRFDPNAAGSRSANAVIDSNAPDVTIGLSGTGLEPKLTPATESITFASRELSAPASAIEERIFTNNGDAEVTVASATKGGANPGDFVLENDDAADCKTGKTVAVGDTCKVRVRFDPTARGLREATVTVDSNGPDVVVQLSGTGIETELTAAPSTLPFGPRDVDAGPTAAQTSTVSNSGTEPVTLVGLSLGGPNPKQFRRLTTGGSDDCAAGTVLLVDDTCEVRAEFDPSFRGAKTATVTVDSNAPDEVVTLTGTGTQSTYEASDVPIPGGYVANGQVNAIAIDPDGRTYLGGTFTSIGPRTGHGAELSASTGAVSSGFPDVDGAIRAVAPDGSGGWYIGGDFSAVGGVPRSRLAHISGSGVLDATWNPGADGRVRTIAAAGTEVYVGGDFAVAGGATRAFVAKLSGSAGAADPTWNANSNGSVHALHLTGGAGGPLYVGGEFTQIGGEARQRIARLNFGGTSDADEWNPGSNGIVSAITTNATAVFVGGEFTTIGAASRNRIAKLSPATNTADATWNPGASHPVRALAADDLDVYAGGEFNLIGGATRNRIAKLPATGAGATDTTFNPNANGNVLALQLDGDSLYAAGEFTQIGGDARNRLAELTLTAGAATGWNPHANATVRALALAGSDLYAGGDFTSVGAQTRNRLARLEGDGTLDMDWNPDVAGASVNALALFGSDLYAGGNFTSVGGQARNRLAKISTTTAVPDPAWNPGATGTVSALAATASHVYAGGLFLTIGGESRNRIAKLAAGDGTVDTGWLPAGAGNAVNALALSGPDLYVGGAFTTIGGQPRGRLARISASAGTVDGWDPKANSAVQALAISATDVFAGGLFTSFDTEPTDTQRNFIAKLPKAGSGAPDPNWDPQANSAVRALALSGTDLYAGGDFTQVSGHPLGRIARMPTTGTGKADAGWDPDVKPDPLTQGSVLALAVTGDRLAAGGQFLGLGTRSSQGFGFLDLPKLTTDPTGLIFGAQDVDEDATAVHESTVTNTGSNAVDIAAVGITGPDAGQFTRIADTETDCTASTLLAPGGTCKVRVQFDPTSTGAKSASVDIAADSPGVSIALRGTGTDTALSRAPTTLTFPSIDVDSGPTQEQFSVITNSGTEPVTVSGVTIGGADPGQFVLYPGPAQPFDCANGTILFEDQTCRVRVLFDPSAMGDRTATVTVASTAGDVNVTVVGRGLQTELTRSPATLPFGPHDIDDPPTAVQESTVTNSGTEDVTLSDVDVSGDADQFVHLTDQPATDCAAGDVLDATETCKLRFRFDPSTEGPKEATVTVTSNADPIAVELSGTGTQTLLTRSPATVPFGSRDIDDPASGAQESTVTNSGTEPVTLGPINVTGDSGQFVRLTDQPATDCETGDVLDEDDTCKLRFRFDPTGLGSKSATVTVNSNAAPITVTLTGTGIDTLLTRNPVSLAFPDRDVDDGATAIQESTVTNSGSETVTLTNVTVTGQSGEFVRLTDQPATDCAIGTELDATETCKLRFAFNPNTEGLKSATVTVSSNAAAITVGLSGTGIQTRLTPDPASLDFGPQHRDTGVDTRETVVTNTGTQTVTLTGVDKTGSSDFTHLTDQPATDCAIGTELDATETCKVRVRFDPSGLGARSGNVAITSNAPTVNIGLTGSGTDTRLERNPTTLPFGNKDIDENATAVMESTVTNTGSENVTISTIGYSGDTGQFALLQGATGDCADGQTLIANASCKIRAQFDPTTVGAKSATVTINSTAASITVGLTGFGTQTELSRNPTTLPFGDKDVDENATGIMESTVTNSGNQNVTITALPESGDSNQFVRVSDEPATDCGAADVLEPTQTCKLRYRFDPSTMGAKSATVTVDSNAPDVAVTLTGTGIQTELSRNPTTLPFGDKDVDENATAIIESTVTNSGSQDVTIADIAASGDSNQFVPVTDQPATDCGAGDVLEATETCKLRYRFDPSTMGSKSATVTVDSNAADVSVTLTGFGTQTELSRNPASLPFGEKDVDENATGIMESTVTNSGNQNVTIAGLPESGDSNQFVRVSDEPATDCGASDVLEPTQTCKLRYRFDPSTMGSKSATVTVDSNAPDVSVGLTGTGIQTELSRSPTSLPFGDKDVDENATAIMESTVTNSGSQDVTIAALPESGDAGQFVRVTDQPTTDCGAGDVLEATETCKLRYRFDPSSVGSKSATVTVDSNAADVAVGLTGTGIQTELSPNPASLGFGDKDIDENATAIMESTVTNTGTQNVTLAGIGAGGDSNQFVAVTDQPATDCGAGDVLAANATCKLRYRFDPSSMGAKSATVTVDSNAADVSVTLTGRGTQTELSRAPATLAFGNHDVDEGPTAVQESTVTNAGSEPVTVGTVSVGGTDNTRFERLTDQPTTDCGTGDVLAANETCKVRVRFDPVATGAHSATVTVNSNAAPVTVALSGTGIQTELSRDPLSLSFTDRDVDDGASAGQTATITNSGSQPLTVSGVSIGGSGASSFAFDPATDCTGTLAGGEDCTVTASFDPATAGAKTATLTVDTNEGASASVGLSGRATQTELSPSPAGLAFGSRDIDDGPSGVLESTVTNSGSEPVTVAAVGAGGDAGQFQRLTGQATDCDAGKVLQALETCKLRLRFDPDSTGAKAATATVDSNAADVSVALSGSGIQSQLALSSGALALGPRDVDEGPTAAQEATLTNTGTEGVTLSAVNLGGGDASQFERLTGQPGDCAAGSSLAAGQTCRLRAEFDPSTVGDKTAALGVSTSVGDLTVALAGRGTTDARPAIGKGPARARDTRGKRFRVQVFARGGPLANVVVTLRNRRGGQLAKLKLASLSSRKRQVALKLRRPLAAGRYVVDVSGRSGGEQVEPAVKRFRLR